MQFEIQTLIQLAMAEDLGDRGDITTAALIPADAQATAHCVNRKPGVIAGLKIMEQVCAALGAKLDIQYHVADGDYAPARTKLCTVTGPAALMLTAERIALNFICRLSGIATATYELQKLITHTSAKVCDTRKTIPGYRQLEKYAVRMGGGTNHRMGLYDMAMFKDKHLAPLGGDIVAAVAKVRAYAPGIPVAVEVETIAALGHALAAKADRIMMDKMSVDIMREAVVIAAGRAEMEATGNITAATIIPIAETGVDFISVGAITHSAPVLDIGLDFE